MSGRLAYVVNCSLDGYIEDADGDFGWAEPDEELHQFYNDLIRPIGSFLYGRRLYERRWRCGRRIRRSAPTRR